ncbi:MAG: hypothetical protein VYE73_03140 [Acidobacteriota bacterium]|nr:hypothetical protein [Acidobacteriota bacterium]
MRKVLVALAVALILAAAVAAIVRVDATELGNRALAAATRSTGIRVSAEHFEIGLFDSLTLHGVKAQGRLSAGPFNGTVERVVLDHKLLPLLWGQLAVGSVTLHNPDLSLRVRGGKPPAQKPGDDDPNEDGTAAERQTARRPTPTPQPTTPAIEDPRVTVESLVIRGGRIAIANPRDQESILIEGLDLDLSHLEHNAALGASLENVDTQGTIRAERIRTDQIEVTEFEGSFQANDGRLVLEDVKAHHETGTLEVHSLETDLSLRRGSYLVVASLRDLDTAFFFGENGDGTDLGRAHLSIAGEGPLATPERMMAKGVLELEPGRLPSIAALAKVDQTVGTSLDQGRYERAHIEFERRPSGHLDIGPFELVAESLSLRAEGRFREDRTLNFKASVGLDADDLGNLSLARDALAALATLDERTWVPVAISGPYDAPRVRIDRKRLEDEIQDVAERALEEGLERVKERFGGELAERLEERLQRELEEIR